MSQIPRSISSDTERDIALGVDLDSTENDSGDGNTRLIQAIAGGYVELVSLLLRHGASPNATNRDRQTPLIVACMNGESEVWFSHTLQNPVLKDGHTLH